MGNSGKRNTIALAALFYASTALLPAFAATDSSTEIEALKQAIALQQQQLKQQQQEIARQQQLLEKQSQQFDRLSSQFNDFTATPISEMQMSEIRGAGTGTKNTRVVRQVEAAPVSPVTVSKPGQKPAKNASAPAVVGSERKPEKPERPPEIAAYIEQGGILLPRGRLVVSPQMEYLNSSATRVAIEGFSIIPALNIGLFEVTELARNTLTGALGLRYGVTNRIELEAKIPYLYRQDSTRNRPIGVGTSSDILSDVNGMGLGDVELGAHYQINNGTGGWPYFIGNLRFKSTTGSSPFDMPVDPTTRLQTELPTGSGFYAIQPSVTAVLPTDPGVFYSNVGYLYNASDDVGGTIGDIDPGDSVNASLGLSVALNDQSSFSLGYSHNMVFRTMQNGFLIPNSRELQIGTLDMGYAYKLSDFIGINFNVSAGVTEDAPDANVIVRVPLTFDLF